MNVTDIDKAQLAQLGQTPAGGVVTQEPEEPDAPRGWINALLVRRKGERNDLVGSIALWAFLSLVVQILLGGSSLTIGGLHLVIPVIDWQVVAALLAPIIGHVAKSTVEGLRR